MMIVPHTKSTNRAAHRTLPCLIVAVLATGSAGVAAAGEQTVVASSDTTSSANNASAVKPSARMPRRHVREEPPALSDRQVAAHVLSRLAFGPRPGQVDEVLEAGWQTWARQQLAPDQIDDAELDAALAAQFPSLFMGMGEIFANYRPDENMERRARERLKAQVRTELNTSVLMRAIDSNRQFNEVIVEFWRNHFNVDHNKDDVAYLANHYEQQVIRQHAFGHFGDMLMASAKHPAMLIYLDNAVSQKPLTDKEESQYVRSMGRRSVPLSLAATARQRGLNENYARELLELHTIGVEHENRRGGYMQQDIVELARVLTGWTVGFWDGQREYGFIFRPKVHDNLPKIVRGRRLSPRGIEEGEAVIRDLAADRRTAAFISQKLCRYLVDDDPPQKLVKRVAGVFRRSRGDLKKVYEAIIFSPEFISPQHHQSKFKTPLEFTVSAIRATGAHVTRYEDLMRGLSRMGQPIYQMDDPTGYLDQSEAWLDPGVLLHRWHFALQLSEGRLDGVRLNEQLAQSLVDMPEDQVKEHMAQQVLPGGMDDQTDRVLTEAMASMGVYRRQVLGFLLGSPAFQQQ